MTSRRIMIGGAVLSAALAALGYALLGDAGPRGAVSLLAQPATTGAIADRPAAVSPSMVPGKQPPVEAAVALRAAASAAAVEAPPALGSGEVPNLEVDARGNLVNDGNTRNQLERLLALNDRTASLQLLQQATKAMPATASRQAMDAYVVYQNYSAALAQAFPHGRSVSDEATASQQLDALHALRVQQFGAETAKAYFDDEEEASRRLLAAMEAERSKGLGFQERVDRAQQDLR